MLREEGVHVDGFTVPDVASRPEMEVISVLDAGRDHPGLTFLGARESDAGDALLDGQEGVLGPMPPFGEHAEGSALGQDAVHFPEGLQVLEHGGGAVADTGQRQDVQEAEELLHGGFLEHVGTGPEGGRGLPAAEDHERIHQRVRMVRGDEDGAVLRDGSFYGRPGVTTTCIAVAPKLQDAIEELSFAVFLHDLRLK